MYTNYIFSKSVIYSTGTGIQNVKFITNSKIKIYPTQYGKTVKHEGKKKWPKN